MTGNRDRPAYPLTVSFLDDGGTEICADEDHLAGTLEVFDSESPDEAVRITDRLGRAVRVKVEGLQVLVCALDEDKDTELNPYAPPKARLTEDGEEGAKFSVLRLFAQAVAFLLWWSTIALLLSPAILRPSKAVLAYWGFVGVYTFLLYRAKIITRAVERVFVGTVLALFGLYCAWIFDFLGFF